MGLQPMQKSDIIQAILEELRGEFESRRSSSVKTRAAGNDEENKAEDKYDTRSTEENYLADGLSRQALAALQAAAAYEKIPVREFPPEEPIDLGALVTLHRGTAHFGTFFLGPSAGGVEVEIEGQSITVITPESPLGRQLMGKKCGDQVSHPESTVVAVC